MRGAEEVNFDSEVLIDGQALRRRHQGIGDDAMFFVGLGFGSFDLFIHPFAGRFFCAAEHAPTRNGKLFGELGVGLDAQHDSIKFPHHAAAHFGFGFVCFEGDEAGGVAPRLRRAIRKIDGLDCGHIRRREVVTEAGVHLGVDKIVEGLPAFEEEEADAGRDTFFGRLHERPPRDINDVWINGTFRFEGPRMRHHLFPKAELIHSFKEFRKLKCHNGIYYTIFPRHIQVGGWGESRARTLLGCAADFWPWGETIFLVGNEIISKGE